MSENKENILDKKVGELSLNELLEFVEGVTQKANGSVTNDEPGEYAEAFADETNWLTREEGMILLKKSGSAFANYCRRNEVDIRGGGHKKKYFKPHLLHPPKKMRRRTKQAA